MKTMMIIMAVIFGMGISANANIKVCGEVKAEIGDPLPGVTVVIKGTTIGVITDFDGKYCLECHSDKDVLSFSLIGMETQEFVVGTQTTINVTLKEDQVGLDEVVVVGYGSMRNHNITGSSNKRHARSGRQKSQVSSMPQVAAPAFYYESEMDIDYTNESYTAEDENKYKSVLKEPLSTFSADVDKASYTNVRRYLNNGQLPPADAVRVEEMINYFSYDYTQPKDKHPFAVHPELAVCPWNEEHYLFKVGVKGKEIEKDNLPPSNLVFLLDVSGSMDAHNKLPLLKSSLKMLVNELREDDYVSIVVYAGAAGLVLEPTSGKDKAKIINALDKLSAGGSTAGGEGLKLAYKTAKEHFKKEGNNRIILATDGDFNVGVSSNEGMEALVEKERNNGIFMTVLGFGMGNYKDDKMEIIADKGNGNYAYIDNIQEAEKVLVSEFGGTLFTIAKDVKFQVEFNPAKVAGYRLIGYENRMLAAEDFNDDKKDAGEIGAGHTVTALYELIPVGAKDAKEWIPSVDKLKYQKETTPEIQAVSDEWLTVKLRYKQPDGDKSTLIEKPYENEVKKLDEASDDFRFAAAVAGFGMLLKKSEYSNDYTYQEVYELAKNAKGKDDDGFKAEMTRLVKTAKSLAGETASK